MRSAKPLPTGLLVVLLFGDVSTQVEAGEVWATEFTQLLNHVELIQQYISELAHQEAQSVPQSGARLRSLLKPIRFHSRWRLYRKNHLD
jgi:hypothetical protein